MDTIFALATPPGKSGVAIVRVSGPRARQAFAALGVRALPAPRQATLASLAAASGETIDRALVLFFPAPHSFTGEDVTEFHLHGSRAVVRAVLGELGAMPSFRPADPGEFTRRAFLSGKMDLTAAEGLADLIDAETEGQRKQALRFMRGDAETFYRTLRADALHALALLEAVIDFPDEDIPAHVFEEARAHAGALTARIEAQLADEHAAERVREGLQVAILGPPNAGKSSLMNLLAKRDVAIVSATPGTTRDVIEVHLDIAGFAVTLADTAGLRETRDEIEAEGVRRSVARAGQADFNIIVLDAQSFSSPRRGEGIPLPFQLASLITPGTILLLNKTDLALPSPLPYFNGQSPIPFSAKTGKGLSELLAALESRAQQLQSAESSFIARARHRHHLTQALTHLKRFTAMPRAGLELQCEELRRAGVEIGRITGAIAVEEVLGEIFSRFCIGK